MILKDLETVGDKPMKKELDESALAGERASSGGANLPLGAYHRTLLLNSAKLSVLVLVLSRELSLRTSTDPLNPSFL